MDEVSKYKYSKYRLMELHIVNFPKGLSERLHFIWGFDIWLHNIPFLKSIILINIIVWIILFI